MTKKTNKIVLLELFLFLCVPSGIGFPYGYDQSVSETDYHNRYGPWEEQGFRLVHVTGFEDEEGIVRYNTIWHKNALHGLAT